MKETGLKWSWNKMLIDVSEHDLAVIKGGLGVLCKRYPTPSENNNVQGTIDNVSAQIDEVYKWQKLWEEMNPVLRNEIDVKVGKAIEYVENTINNLVIDDELRKHLKKTVMRCELK